MTISEYQKTIIRDNPTMTVSELSKLADCSETTIKVYRRKLRALKQNGPKEGSADGQKSGQESVDLPARVIIEEGDKKPMYTPSELATDLSDVCRSELAMYKVAEEKIRKNGPDQKLVWDASQHFKNYVSGATSLAKWYGMEKLTLVAGKKPDISQADFDKMSNDEIEALMKKCLE